MPQYQSNPQSGHIEFLYYIFSYLTSHMKMGGIGYDPMGPNVDFLVFNNNVDWTEFCMDVQEYLLPKMPEPRVRAVSIHFFVDANHAGNDVTSSLHTGIGMFIQNAPIICFSKVHNTVKVAMFGSELVAPRIFKDLIVELRYKGWR